MVLEALVTSVRCKPSLDNLLTKKESIVPNLSFPASASLLAPSTLSNIHFIFVAEKYGSITKPVLALTISSYPFSFNDLHNS